MWTGQYILYSLQLNGHTLKYYSMLNLLPYLLPTKVYRCTTAVDIHFANFQSNASNNASI